MSGTERLGHDGDDQRSAEDLLEIMREKLRAAQSANATRVDEQPLAAQAGASSMLNEWAPRTEFLSLLEADKLRELFAVPEDKWMEEYRAYFLKLESAFSKADQITSHDPGFSREVMNFLKPAYTALLASMYPVVFPESTANTVVGVETVSREHINAALNVLHEIVKKLRGVPKQVNE